MQQMRLFHLQTHRKSILNEPSYSYSVSESKASTDEDNDDPEDKNQWVIESSTSDDITSDLDNEESEHDDRSQLFWATQATAAYFARTLRL